MKILNCIVCGLEMEVPPTSSKEWCSECLIKHRKEIAHSKYLEAIENGSIIKYRETGRKYMRELNKNNPSYRLMTRARNRAKIANLEFNITPSDITIPERCPVLDTPFEYKTYYTASLDRIDSSKGYVKDNIQVMSHKANAMKNSATPKELIKFAEWVLRTYGSQAYS